MKIGFTGTRFGMTNAQKRALRWWLENIPTIPIPVTEFHHGDCVGADVQAAKIADVPAVKIVCHPPVDETHRGFYPFNDVTYEPKTHFARNRDIVDDTDAMIAAPRNADPITKDSKGGTSYTVMYARKRRKGIMVIWPDGTTSHEPPTTAAKG